MLLMRLQGLRSSGKEGPMISSMYFLMLYTNERYRVAVFITTFGKKGGVTEENYR
jgi:hypothetical protein